MEWHTYTCSECHGVSRVAPVSPVAANSSSPATSSTAAGTLSLHAALAAGPTAANAALLYFMSAAATTPTTRSFSARSSGYADMTAIAAPAPRVALGDAGSDDERPRNRGRIPHGHHDSLAGGDASETLPPPRIASATTIAASSTPACVAVAAVSSAVSAVADCDSGAAAFGNVAAAAAAAGSVPRTAGTSTGASDTGGTAAPVAGTVSGNAAIDYQGAFQADMARDETTVSTATAGRAMRHASSGDDEMVVNEGSMRAAPGRVLRHANSADDAHGAQQPGAAPPVSRRHPARDPAAHEVETGVEAMAEATKTAEPEAREAAAVAKAAADTHEAQAVAEAAMAEAAETTEPEAREAAAAAMAAADTQEAQPLAEAAMAAVEAQESEVAEPEAQDAAAAAATIDANVPPTVSGELPPALGPTPPLFRRRRAWGRSRMLHLLTPAGSRNSVFSPLAAVRRATVAVEPCACSKSAVVALHGAMPLHMAALLGRAEAVRTLLTCENAGVNAMCTRIVPASMAECDFGPAAAASTGALCSSSASFKVSSKVSSKVSASASIPSLLSFCSASSSSARAHRSIERTTALHLAVLAGHGDVINALLNSNATVDFRDADGKTALDLALPSLPSGVRANLVASRRLQAVALLCDLLQQKGEASDRVRVLLPHVGGLAGSVTQAPHGVLAAARAVLASGAVAVNLPSPEHQHMCPLEVAVRENHLTLVRVLLEHGAVISPRVVCAVPELVDPALLRLLLSQPWEREALPLRQLLFENACRWNRTEAAVLLLDAGVRVTLSLLQRCVAAEAVDTCRVLFRRLLTSSGPAPASASGGGAQQTHETTATVDGNAAVVEKSTASGLMSAGSSSSTSNLTCASAVSAASAASSTTATTVASVSVTTPNAAPTAVPTAASTAAAAQPPPVDSSAGRWRSSDEPPLVVASGLALCRRVAPLINLRVDPYRRIHTGALRSAVTAAGDEGCPAIRELLLAAAPPGCVDAALKLLYSTRSGSYLPRKHTPFLAIMLAESRAAPSTVTRRVDFRVPSLVALARRAVMHAAARHWLLHEPLFGSGSCNLTTYITRVCDTHSHPLNVLLAGAHLHPPKLVQEALERFMARVPEGTVMAGNVMLAASHLCPHYNRPEACPYGTCKEMSLASQYSAFH